LPQELLTAAHRHDMAALDALGLNACIECGCCDYVCPSGIPMTARFIAAKRDLHQHETAVRAAAHARARFENREQRLQKEGAERDHDLQEQVDELADPQTIEAVMARVKSRRDPE
jgi:electron transport complex protein RnfC